MKQMTTTVLKACSFSIALLGSTAIIAAIALPDMAYADNGKGNGGGNGGGNDKGGGNGGGNDKGGGKSDKPEKSKGGSDKGSDKGEKTTSGAEKSAKASKKEKKPKRKDLAEELGLSPSELGALNAAHASPNALKNASPNSRVGRIAAYRDAVLAGEELEAELEEKQAELDLLTPPERPLSEIKDDVAAADDAVDTKAAEVADLEADLAEAGGTDAEIEAALDAARDELASAEAAAEELRDEQAAAVEYETVSGEVDELTQKVEDQPEVERDLLEAAANKPVTDEVEAAVKKLLGL